MDAPVLHIVAGAIVGTLIGLTGVGGGSVMTPILVLLFNQPLPVAVGTDLVFSASTKFAATASFGYSHRVDWVVVRRLILGSVPGALTVIAWFWWSHQTPGAIEQLMARALAVVLALAAVVLLSQQLLRRVVLRLTLAWSRRPQRHTAALTTVAGFFLGAAITLTSVGAGALGIVALLALYPLRLNGDRLVATDIAHALPVTALAGATHAFLGHVDVQTLGFLLAGSVPAVLLSSRMTLRLPTPLINVLIAVMLIVVSQKLLFMK